MWGIVHAQLACHSLLKHICIFNGLINLILPRQEMHLRGFPSTWKPLSE